MMRRILWRYLTQNRIYIHKSTLDAVGNPKFIHIGFQPERKNLMILGKWINESKAVRVCVNKNGVFCISSKALIDGLRIMGSCLKRDGSYYLTGHPFTCAPAISFPIHQLSDIQEKICNETDTVY